MKSFLEKVRSATKAMGTAPYDDKKTFEVVLEATKRTVEYNEKMKKIKAKK
ncbi:MAG TPA: hypothetical protein VEF53_04455 [Patescibacteria group bacterium]|nr:hypothetical protein [Patescibacteria group bacterium]